MRQAHRTGLSSSSTRDRLLRQSPCHKHVWQSLQLLNLVCTLRPRQSTRLALADVSVRSLTQRCSATLLKDSERGRAMHVCDVVRRVALGAIARYCTPHECSCARVGKGHIARKIDQAEFSSCKQSLPDLDSPDYRPYLVRARSKAGRAQLACFNALAISSASICQIAVYENRLTLLFRRALFTRAQRRRDLSAQRSSAFADNQSVAEKKMLGFWPGPSRQLCRLGEHCGVCRCRCAQQIDLCESEAKPSRKLCVLVQIAALIGVWRVTC